MNPIAWVRSYLAHRPLAAEQRGRLLAEAAADQADRWVPGTPLSETRNAHYTNTPAELEQGLRSDANWLEGDIGREWGLRKLPLIGRFQQPIMAHDPYDVNGLSLDEWLAIGVASGKGLKLDFKSSSGLAEILDKVESCGLPDESLMFNSDVIAGPGSPRIKGPLVRFFQDRGFDLAQLQEIRARFPDAVLSLGCLTGKQPPGTRYGPRELEKLKDFAIQVGGPINFPLRAEFVDASVVDALKPYGTVSIWNDPDSFKPTPEDVLRFRAMGVDGVIDLRSS